MSEVNRPEHTEEQRTFDSVPLDGEKEIKESKATEQEKPTTWKHVEYAIFGRGKYSQYLDRTKDSIAPAEIGSLLDNSDLPKIKTVSLKIITEKKNVSPIKRLALFITQDIPKLITESLSSIKGFFTGQDKNDNQVHEKPDVNKHSIDDNAREASLITAEEDQRRENALIENIESLFDHGDMSDKWPKDPQSFIDRSNETADQSQEKVKQGRKKTDAPGKHSKKVLVDRDDAKNEGPAVGA